MNAIITTYFTSYLDVQRNIFWKNNDHNITNTWAKSIHDNNLNGIILHDNCVDEEFIRYYNPIKFIKVNTNYNFSCIDYRWYCIYELLNNPKYKFDYVFITDLSDVRIVNSPFTSLLNDKIYMGNDNAGIVNSNNYLNKIIFPQLHDYHFDFFKIINRPVLNCGVVGGHISIIIPLIKRVLDEFNNIKRDNKRYYDMAIFNYILYKYYYNDIVQDGVASIFKKYQNHRKDVWFIHK